MKLLITAALFFAPFVVNGQAENGSYLDKKVATLTERNNKLTKDLTSLKRSNESLNKKVTEMSERVQQEITRSQELQAQNEKAMNLALDEFSKKFEAQNETVKNVQNQLDQKFNNQLIIFLLSFVFLIIIGVVIMRNSTQKALKQNVANWNQFQEHLLKK